jgi:WD40 repeat protein
MHVTAIPVPAANFVQHYRGHLEEITGIAWSPTGNKQLIASASSDGNILIWSIEHDSIVHCISMLGRVKSLCWSPTIPGLLYAGGEDHSISIWRLSDLPPFDNTKKLTKITLNTLNLNTKMIGKSGTENNKAVPAKRSADVTTPNQVGTPTRKKAKGNVDAQLLVAAEAAIQSKSRFSTCSECLHLAVSAGNTVTSIIEYMANETKNRIGEENADKREQFVRYCSSTSATDLIDDQDVSSLLFKRKNDVRDLIKQEGKSLLVAILHG